MLQQVNQLLRRKYPFEFVRLNSILIISILVSLVIFIYQPFGFSQYRGNKLLGALPFGIATFGSLFCCNYILKGKILKHRIGRWTIFHEAVYILTVFLVLAFFNTLIFLFFFEDIYAFRNGELLVRLEILFRVLLITVAVGIFPVTAVIAIRYHRAMRHHMDSIIRSDQQLQETNPSQELVFPSANITEAPLQISLHDFLFLEVVKNHVHVYHYTDGQVTSTVIRNTLTTILETVQAPTLFRCHRSFIVNLTHIKTATGNSNGYKIMLKDYEHYPIPVSRSFVPAFQEIIH